MPIVVAFVFSMSLASVGELVEPLIFERVNADWFSASFVLANAAGSLAPIYFPKDRVFLPLALGTSLVVVTEFLLPLTPYLSLLVA